MKKLFAALALALAVPALAAVTDPGPARRDTIGDAVTTAFTFPFPVQKTSDIEVYVNGAKQVAGYTIALAPAPVVGGTVTFTIAPPAESSVRIQRMVPKKQETVYTPYSAFPAKTTEKALDRIVMQLQEVDRDRQDLANVVGTGNPTASLAQITATGGTVDRELRDIAADEVNVLFFIPKSLHAGIKAQTETTNVTAYLQAAIDYAAGGTVFIPEGKYYHSGLTTNRSTKIRGAGWTKTILRNVSVSTPGIKLNPQPGVPDYTVGGPVLRDLQLTGTSTGAALLVDTQTHLLLRNLYILSNAGKGIHISDVHHVYGVTVDHCIIQSNAGDGIYGRTEDYRQVNVVKILNGTEIATNGGAGVNVWANDLTIRDSIIEGNTGPGILLNADDMVTANASARSITIDSNYFELNYGGHIKASTTFRNLGGGAYVIHYLLGLRIQNNYMIMQNPFTAGVTAHIVLDCTDGLGVACGVDSAYRGVFLGTNYVWASGTQAYVDFKGAHTNSTRLVPFLGSEQVGGVTGFSNLYLNAQGVYVISDKHLSGSGAPASSSDYIGQAYLDAGAGMWYRSRSAGNGASDWLAGYPIIDTARNGVNRLQDGSALDTASWLKGAVTVTADVDGIADRIQVATGAMGTIYQAENVNAGENFSFSFEAKENGGNAAKYMVWDVTHQAMIVPQTSYFSRINGSSYTTVETTFTVPAGCTQIAVYPVGITSLNTETTDVLIKNVQLWKMDIGFLKFAWGSATVLNGAQTAAVDISLKKFNAAPACTITGSTANRAYKATSTATQLTVDAGAVLGGNETVSYTCIGQ